MLIVEDQDQMRRALREFLQSALPDKLIHEARDGRSALALCNQHRPNVVLLDIGLPDTNGIDLIGKIKSIRADTAVIIVSSQNSSAHVQRARAAGAFAYVNKDAVTDQLLPAVKAALDLLNPDHLAGNSH